MNKFKFICEGESLPFTEGFASKKTFEFTADRMDVILSEFQDFLKGCGYIFDGNIVVEDNQDEYFANFDDTMNFNHASETVSTSGSTMDTITIGGQTFSFGQSEHKF